MQRRDVATAQSLDHFRYHLSIIAASKVALVATVEAKRIGEHLAQQVIWSITADSEIGRRVGDLQRIDLLQRRWLDHSCYFRHFVMSGVGIGWQRGYCRYWVRFCWVG